MADDVDRAGERIEQELAMHLRVRKPTIVPCGHCHYCSNDIHEGSLFCDSGCAGDWEWEQDAKRRNGLP